MKVSKVWDHTGRVVARRDLLRCELLGPETGLELGSELGFGWHGWLVVQRYVGKSQEGLQPNADNSVL